MLIWLDSTANRKAQPNENYAREVMELFTLGRGHYTEKDVQEAARAFTGWFVVRDRFQRGRRPARRRREDDPRPDRPVRRRRHPGDPARPARLRRVPLRQAVPRTSSARSTRPARRCSPRWREAFRASGYDVRVPVATILRSNLFFDPAIRRRRVKSPVEFAVGTIRALEVLKPTVAGRRPGRGLRADGPEPVRPAERRRLGRRPRLGQLDDDAHPDQPRPGPALRRGRRALGGRCDPGGPGRAGTAVEPRSDAGRVPRRPARPGRLRRPTLRRSSRWPRRCQRPRTIPRRPSREAATLVLTSPEYQLA